MKNTISTVFLVTVLAAACTAIGPAKADWVVSYAAPVFYQDLSPHGSWFIMQPYGWVWQPQVVSVSAGWRPYCHGGSWLWTDYGWYWESSYSWGWIPFHFGWWVLSPRSGWVWVPGSYWAPAWVCWRSAPGYYGWAPLPPPPLPGAYLGLGFDSGDLCFDVSVSLTAAHYLFVPEDRVCEPAVESRAAPAPEAQELYATSTPRRDFGTVREKAAAVLSNRPAVAAVPQAQAFMQQSAPRPAVAERQTRTFFTRADQGAPPRAGSAAVMYFAQAPNRVNQAAYRSAPVQRPVAAGPSGANVVYDQRQRAAAGLAAVRRTAPAVAERAEARVAALSERAQALRDRAEGY